MALFGALLLVFVVFIRPQEFVPGLIGTPLLNVTIVIAVLGVLVEIATGKTRLKFPQLPFLAAYYGWAFLVTFLNAGLGEALDLRFNRNLLFGLLVTYGTTTLGAFRSMAILLIGIALTVCYVAVAQSRQPFECYQILEEDVNPIGVACEAPHDCIEETKDYVSDFECEKPGPWDTQTVAHGRARWRGILADPNEMSLALGAALAFAFALHASWKFFLRHAALVAICGVVTWAVVLSGSRGGVLILLAVIGTYFVRRQGAKGVVVAAMFGAPIFLLGGRETEDAEASAMERVGALYEGMTFVKEHPIIGLGVGQFTENYFITAHNSYVLTCSELGFPGLVLWSFLVYMTIKVPYTLFVRPPPGLDPRILPFALGLATSFAGILVGIFFLSFCYHAVFFIYMGLSAAMFLMAKRSAPSFEVKISPKEMMLLAAGDLALMIVIFVYTRVKGAP